MEFDVRLPLDVDAVQVALGVPQADAGTRRLIEESEAALQEALRPKWLYRSYRLEGRELACTGLVLPGQGIAAHLRDCQSCILLALTLGEEVERLLRAAQASDLARAVLLDGAASVLAEQYADLAEGTLRGAYTGKGLYLTGRFSPGYGDLPLSLQRQVLGLLGAQKAIGLTVSETGILLPRKSITALLGVANVPVTGAPARCEDCAIREKCTLYKEGRRCGGAVEE